MLNLQSCGHVTLQGESHFEFLCYRVLSNSCLLKWKNFHCRAASKTTCFKENPIQK